MWCTFGILAISLKSGNIQVIRDVLSWIVCVKAVVNSSEYRILTFEKMQTVTMMTSFLTNRARFEW